MKLKEIAEGIGGCLLIVAIIGIICLFVIAIKGCNGVLPFDYGSAWNPRI